MRAYIIRRLLLIIPTLLGVTIIVFFMSRLIPGNVIDIMLSEMALEAGTKQLTTESLRQALGFDVPAHIQYWHWLTQMVLHGDLGNSLWTGRSITQELLNRLPVSLELGTLALISALCLAVPVGVYSAIRQDTKGDYAARSVGILAICLPSFWVGTLVIIYPSIWWGWSPSIDYIRFFSNPVGNLIQFLVPAIILGMVMSGTTMRVARTMMLEVLRQDYIRTAWAKGLNERVVINRHALKNAVIPVITVIGVMMPILVGGAVIIEQIFSLPGIGRLLLEALNRRDYPVISGINVVLAVVVLLINLVIDLTYAWLDPRVQYK